MRASVILQPPQQLRAQAVIVLYGTPGFSTPDLNYATFHEVKLLEERLVTLPGSPLTQEAVGSILRAFGKTPRVFLPERLLAYGMDTVTWFVPAGKRTLYFESANAELNRLSGQSFAQPPLVFHLEGKALSVYAVPENQRPGRDTVLHQAPYMNLTAGKVCLGSMRTFEPHPDHMLDWEEAFFESAFTHGNGLPCAGLDHLQLWQKVLEQGEFDTSWLIPLGKTVGGM